MQYGQIVLGLFILLVLYYIGMIVMDLMKANASKAAELDNQTEEDIDISDEADTFQPIQVSRDEPKKQQEQSADSQPDNQPEDKDDEHKPESDGADSPDEAEDEKDERNEEEAESGEEAPETNDGPRPAGYREAIMTDGFEIEKFLEIINKIAEDNTTEVGALIFSCESMK